MAVFLEQLQNLAMTALATAVVTIVIGFYKAGMAFLKAKIDQSKQVTDSEQKRAFLEFLSKVCDDVSASFDPVAEKLKMASADGHLSADDINMLKHDSFEAVKDIVEEVYSYDTLEAIGFTPSAIQDMIANAIEASLQRRKKGIK